MKNQLKKIKLSTLLTHVLLTLAYPVVKTIIAPEKRLLVFTDVLTITALILLAVGIFYNMVLHGYFDSAGYFVQSGFRSFTKNGLGETQKKSPDVYMREARERREGAFNYPLLLSIMYLLICVVIVYGFY